MLKELVARLMVNRSKSRQYPVEYLERKHVKLDGPFPNDSSYFYGSDKAGMRLSRAWPFVAPTALTNTGSIFVFRTSGSSASG